MPTRNNTLVNNKVCSCYLLNPTTCKEYRFEISTEGTSGKQFNNNIKQKVYHRAEQKVSNTPLFSGVEIRCQSSCFKSQWICHSLNSWWLYVVNSSSTNLPFGVYIYPYGLKNIRWIRNFKYVWTRRQQCHKTAIVSTRQNKSSLNTAKLNTFCILQKHTPLHIQCFNNHFPGKSALPC